jgi:hypothetical protein
MKPGDLTEFTKHSAERYNAGDFWLGPVYTGLKHAPKGHRMKGLAVSVAEGYGRGIPSKIAGGVIGGFVGKALAKRTGKKYLTPLLAIGTPLAMGSGATMTGQVSAMKRMSKWGKVK